MSLLSLTVPAQKEAASVVREIMEMSFETADPGEKLESAFVRLQTCGCLSLPTVRAGRLVGALTIEKIGEFIMIQSALRRSPLPRLPQPA